jgi:hypothetical protein
VTPAGRARVATARDMVNLLKLSGGVNRRLMQNGLSPHLLRRIIDSESIDQFFLMWSFTLCIAFIH